MRALTVLPALLLALCAAYTAAAALPEEYIANIQVPDAPVLSEEEESDSEQASEVRTPFPWIRLVDSDGDRRPDLLLLGEEIRIVIASIDISNATLPCGNAAPGSGELRDCGEGTGASSPGGCEPGLSTTICRTIGSVIQVDIVI
jgi:hypothetical protein